MTSLGRPRSLPRRILQSIDWVLVTLVAGIVTLALINLNSAGQGDWTGKIQTQIRWLGLGTIAAACVAALDYRVLHRVAYAAYGFGFMLLGLVPLVVIIVIHLLVLLLIVMVQAVIQMVTVLLTKTTNVLK